MTHQEALDLMNVSGDTAPAVVQEKFQQSYNQLLILQNNAPTPNLKKLYLKNLQELEEAYFVITTQAVSSADLPSSEPSYQNRQPEPPVPAKTVAPVEEPGRPAQMPAKLVSDTARPKPAKSNLTTILAVTTGLALLLAGYFFFQSQNPSTTAAVTQVESTQPVDDTTTAPSLPVEAAETPKVEEPQTAPVASENMPAGASAGKQPYSVESGLVLYMGCANKVSIQNPTAGAAWNPTFSATGATVIKGGKGEITVVPNAASVSLKISNQGAVIGVRNFRAIAVPQPICTVYINGAEADYRRGVEFSSLRSVQVRAVPDAGFKGVLPDDANFRTKGFSVMRARGGRKLSSVTLGPNGGSIADLTTDAEPGDRLVIEIEGMERRNFRGDISEVPLTNRYIVVPLY